MTPAVAGRQPRHSPPSVPSRASRRRPLSAALLCAALLAPVLRAQGPPQDTGDPANLKGERVSPQLAEPLAVDQGARGVATLLRELNTRASLLMIVAHPDDEDGGMLTYESRGEGARVSMLTLTRGEGGQNVMSGDFNDALGLVRTRELLAADQYLRVHQLFGTEVDFGFSKTKQEAFAQWTHQRVLYDAVRAVRLTRPLVLTSVFVGAPTDGHGQHQVSGEITQEVFSAAADPRVFPEMGLPPWQPAKVYARVPFARIDSQGMFDYATGKYVPVRFTNYVTGAVSTTAPTATVTIPEGEPSPLLGMSFVQFARQGLALQRTQIGSGVRLAPAGRFDVGYTRYGARPGIPTPPTESSFFVGVDISLAGIATLAPSLAAADARALRDGLAEVQAGVSAATAALSLDHPEAAEPGLRRATVALDALLARVSAWTSLPGHQQYDLLHELRIKRVEANDALVTALGLTLQAHVVAAGSPVPLPSASSGSPTPTPPRAVSPGQALTVAVELHNGGAATVGVRDETARYARGMSIDHAAGASPGMAVLAPGARLTEPLYPRLTSTAPLSRPYYTRRDLEQPVYTLLDPSLRNAPLTPPTLTTWQALDWNGVALEIGAITRVFTPPSPGAPTAPAADPWLQPLRTVSLVSVALAPAVAMLPETEKHLALQASLRSDHAATAAEGTLHLDLPSGWTVSPATIPFRPAGEGAPQTTALTLSPRDLGTAERSVTAVATLAGTAFTEGYRSVGYPGLIHDDLYQPATTRIHGLDIHVPPGLRVAYLPGTGDSVEDAFAQIGIRASTVSVADIAAGRLAGFDALVLGVRAFAAHADLGAATPQMLAFARAGGSVVVQYNTEGFGAAEAPFPLSLGAAEKVVEEHAPVRLLTPDAQVLRWPNRLSAADFDGWVEERGHGFLASWAPEYQAPTEVHDAGQDPQRGGLLVAPIGKGAFVYCAFALYRQLPEGVPGAFRLLVNLVSLGQHPGQQPGPEPGPEPSPLP